MPRKPTQNCLSFIFHINTLKRGERRRDKVDPGDKIACLPPLLGLTFLECLFKSTGWSSFVLAGDSLLLSVETEETGADKVIVEESCSWDETWGKFPVMSIYRNSETIVNLSLREWTADLIANLPHFNDYRVL